MKYWKLILCGLLALALVGAPLVGCTQNEPEEESSEDDGVFSYSEGIDDNGYWESITAKDYVTLADYSSIEIPTETYTITDDAVQTEIESIVSSYSSTEEITDRAIEDGDTVNIDYVGSVDGVEFSGGNTNGAGAEVTIGVTNYIDDFLEQLIGHTPGETMNVEVTFPEDYGNEEVDGKDAVFVVTINHIVGTVDAELSDEFVTENFSESDGWSTVAEMEEGVRESLQASALTSYIQEDILNLGTVENLPEELVTYQENAMVAYYEEYAGYYGVSVDEFLSTYVGVESMEQAIEDSTESNKEAATYYLIIQAIAEDQGMVGTEEDVANYFLEYNGSEDYSTYEESHGLPYLKQFVLTQKVLAYLEENAVLA